MKIANILSLMTSILLFFFFIGHVHVQAASSTTEQQELDQVMEMMKKSGMDPKQMKQMEGLFKNMSEMETKRKAAQANKAKMEFESATAGHGTAQVEVEGKQYALMLTKCEVKDSRNAAFLIKASQAPGMDQGELSFHSDGINLNNSFTFSTQSVTSKYYRATNTSFEFNGQSLAWQGLVETSSGKVPLTLNLSCGDEAVYYDKPSRPRPNKPNNVLTMYLGSETFEFEAGRCTLNGYRTGNLMVDFEATATGKFRGRPAIILLSKSHGVGMEGRGRGYFHNFDLLLGELSDDQRKLSPFKVKKQLSGVVEAYQSKQLAKHQKKYSKEVVNALPPNKMIEVMEASQKEMSAYMDRAESMRFPEAQSRGGAITINGKNILFRGPAMHTNDADRAPEFQDISETPELFVTCGV